MKGNQYSYKHRTHYDVLREESNFDRMKRKRKRRELVVDFAYALAAVTIILLGIAAVATG